MKFPLKALFFLVFSLSFGLVAQAAEVRLAETYTVSPSERIYGNLYAAAESLVVSGEIFGDVFLSGGEVIFSGKGNTDVIFVGGKVESLGLINGDLRATGFKLGVSGGVGGDVVLFGGLVEVLPGVLVRGDVVAVGAKVLIGGNVLGDVYVLGNDVFINGKVSGNVKIYSAGKVELGHKADIGGSVTYSSNAPATVSDTSFVAGDIIYQPASPIIVASDLQGFVSGLFGWFFLIRLVITLAGVLVFVLVFRRLSAELVRISVDNFWKTSATGLVTLVAIPFASLFLILTILGGAIGLILSSIGFTMAIVSCIYVGVVFGYLCSKYIFKMSLPDIISWKLAVVGSLAAHVLFLVPYVGVVVWLLLFINSFGAVSYLAYKHFFTVR